MWAVLSSDAPPALTDSYVTFLSGDFDGALEALRFEPLSLDRTLLEAHILYWARRRESAVTVLSNGLKHNPGDMQEPRRALASAMLGAAHASIGNEDEARDAISAIRYDESETHAAVWADVHFYRAFALWTLRDYRMAKESLDHIDQEFATAISRARVLMLRGWLAASEDRVSEQVRLLVECLRVLDGLNQPDVTLVAMALRTLAALGRDTLNQDALDAVNAHQSFEWTKYMDLERFQVTRTIAWARAMHGDYIRAGEMLIVARRIAPSPYMKMLAHLDRAWVASVCNNDRLHQRLELGEAKYYAEQIEWSSAAEEEVGALVLAAELFAPIDAAVARAFLQQAEELRVRGNMGLAHGVRARAWVLTAEAAIRRAEGDERTATLRAEEAFALFKSVDYHWRAGNLALDLYTLTGDAKWLEHVRDVAAAYPRSFIAAELTRREAAGRSILEELTPRQREIAQLIHREGLTNNEIAKRLVCSSNTVRIHKRQIFQKFRVKNEFQLVTKMKSLAS